jgi:two-component sensor histidine kinase
VLAEAVATRDRNEALRAALASATAMVAEKDRLLNERNLLAREMQHRVRNNLQLISEMVNAQLRQTPDEAAQKSLSGIIRKIMTLAEVYEHLLGSGMNGKIDLGAYALALCAKLPDLQPSPEFAVSRHCNAARVQVTLASATALGLTMTELISNSYEHAFPGRGGTIGVRVARCEQADQGVITIAGDGIGYVQAAETRRHGVGLARRLMQQVEGTLEVAADAGTVWTLRFPVMPVVETAAATV